MTPEELDAIEARYTVTDDAVDWRTESDVWETSIQVPALVAALREAWDEVERQRAMWQALDTAVRKVTAERDEAEAALDRVRAVIALRTAHDCPSCGVLAREVEAAIEGES